MTPSPSVSVIVCASDQPAHLERALASVVRAAALLPESVIEILVVDEGPASDVPVVLRDERMRRVSAPRTGAGAARAAGLAAARGELIAYCDADDEWAPGHLRALLEALHNQPDVALVFGDAVARDGRSRAVDDPPAIELLVGDTERFTASRIHASDVLHRASAARDVGGFDPSLCAYADVDLWLRMDEAHLLRHLPVTVTIRDGPVVSDVASNDPDERERLLLLHHLARPCREQGLTPRDVPRFDPATWSPPRRELHWQSPLNPYQSFGLVGRELLRAAARAGIEATLASPPPRAEPEWQRFAVSEDGGGRIGFSYDYWHRPTPLPAELLVAATMREGTLIPRARVNAINQTAALLYVPCRQNLESFRACGVRAPIKVLPYGVDAARFPYLERARGGDAPYTFGTFGALSSRKGTDVLLRAFGAEFAPAEPVRLLLKSVDELPFVPDSDPRIRVITGFWQHDDLLGLLREIDAFVLPSRAEGFGLCGLEAMATGLPTIATAWSGPADYLDAADSLPLHYNLVDAAGMEANGVRYFGEWAEPDVEHLRSLLRWLYEHRLEARHMGKLASARVHRAWTWDRAATQLRDDLDMLASGVSPA